MSLCFSPLFINLGGAGRRVKSEGAFFFTFLCTKLTENKTLTVLQLKPIVT